MAIANPTLWRPNTQQWLIAEALVKHDLNRKRAFAADIRPLVGREPLIFKGKRADGAYGPLDHDDQCRRAWYRAGDVLKAIREYGWDREAGIKAAESEGSPVETPAVDPTPIGFDPEAEKRFLLREVRRIRSWLTSHSPDLDHLSYRPLNDGRKMIEAGIPAKALLYAMAMHWPAQSRVQAGIADFDPERDFEGGRAAYLDALAKARVLIMLTGPAGMGKSYWAANLARRLGLPFGSIPMAEGATPSWLLGRQTLQGFSESRFAQIWRDGGVFLFDEMDAADPNMLLVINDALANGVLYNPVDGSQIERHPDCILIAATNTLGLGADRNYTGRNRLDFSTLDRWRMGRVTVPYSADTEEAILFA